MENSKFLKSNDDIVFNNTINDEEVYISIKKFCELKDICIQTFYANKNKKFKYLKSVKLEGYRKKYIQFSKKDFIFLDKDNKIVCFNNF